MLILNISSVLIGKNENEKLLKAIDQLEKQRILEKLNIAPIDILA